METKILFCIKYYFFLFLACVVQKPLFMLYHVHRFAPEATLDDYWQVIRHGLPLDFSTAAYLCILPFLVIALSFFLENKTVKNIFRGYSILIFSIITLVFCIDLDLYTYWNFRLDSTVFTYLDSPKNVAASFDFWLVVRQLIFWGICFYCLWVSYRKFIEPSFDDFEDYTQKIADKKDKKACKASVFVLLAAFLFLPIRGGVSDATMNVGWVYFSKNMFMNHAAINPMWNLFDTMMHKNPLLNKQYRFFDPDRLQSIYTPLAPKTGNSDFPRVLKTERPNVILVILESFSGHIIEPLGGEPGVAPNLSRLCDEGILFTQFYANSYRTDRGVVCVMSGFPVPPKYSVMKNPNKNARLANIGSTLKNAGYDIAFYYGGDENFTNMRSYLVNGGFEHIISDNDFSLRDYSTSWGAVDHVVFQRLLDDLHNEKHETPFFRTLLTLSSHEPFDVPMETKFAGKSHDQLYRNSAYYTDRAIGNFVAQAKKEPWWKNTVVIFVADHSLSFPEGIESYTPSRFQIPCLWIGGAVKSPMKCNKTASQVDICATLLAQMNLPHDKFIFSKNILDESQPKFAFFSYVHGFGMIEGERFCAFDLNTNEKISDGKTPTDDRCAEDGKAYLQYIYDCLADDKK